MSPATALLAHAEPLAHPRRMRELALFARGIAGTPELHDLLADLAARGPYERRLALHMAMAARDLDHVARALAGSDLDLRRAALRAVRTLPVPDDGAARVLDDAPEALRRAFYRTLLHARRHALADRLLPEVRGRWGDREAAALLPACGPATVARSLDGLAHAVPSWRALGKHHPGPLLDLAERRWMPVRHWMHAAHADPARALALLERRGLGPRAQLIPEAFFALLARTDPVRTGRLLLGDRTARRRPARPTLRRYLRSCPDSELLRVPNQEHALAWLLAALPVNRRGRIFRAAVERRGGPFPGLGALRLLDLLPPADAAAEARRMLGWHGSVWHSARARLDDPALPLRLTAYLPYDEASGPLAEAATDGDPRRRGLARTLLVECAARTGDPVTLAECVGGLAPRLLNERDPLRGVLPEALARVRPRLLTVGLVPDLRRLSTAAIEAKDSSAATRRAFGDLAARVLRHLDDPALVAWALKTCGAVIARDGARERLDLVLRRGQEHDLLDVLRPHLDAARARGDLTPAISLARALRRRAFGIAELQDDLRTAAPDDREAAGLWLAAGGERRALELLEAAPSTIALPKVWHVVATRRTDLLLPSLGTEVPVVAGEERRWTSAQRETVRALLEEAAADASRAFDERDRAARSLASMARAEDPATAAEALLVRADDPAARAALTRCCRAMPPSRLAPLLDAALIGPGSRVGVRKLAARQLERRRPAGAADILLRAWADPGLHRDVRAAVGGALLQMPEDPRCLAALETASGRHPSEALARTLLRAKPSGYAPDDRPRVAGLIRNLLVTADDPGVRFRASRAFAAWAEWYAGGHDEIIAAAGDPDDPAGEEETEVLAALVRQGRVREPAIEVLRRLLDAPPGAGPHRRIDALVGVLTPGRGTPAYKRELARRAAGLLEAHPLHLTRAVRLRIELLPWDEDGLADALPPLAAMLRDRPVLAAKLFKGLPLRFRTAGPEGLLPAARILAGGGDLVAELLALALVRFGGQETRWGPPWAGLRDVLRSSRHLDVRQLAWDEL